MPRSDEAQAFFHAVYSAVQEIPHGKVTTYGHIAMLVGTRTKPSLTQKPKSLTSNSSKTSSSRRLSKTPPRRSIPALQPRHRPMAKSHKLQRPNITQVRLPISYIQFISDYLDLNLEVLALKLMPSKQKAYKSRQTQWVNTQLTSPNTAGSQTYSPQKKTIKANE
ncbi:MGMT family [Fusarium napiforme]|uniref:MGMT family n=1 Tax=Fusarium napiforme TaxID=42672 RepID=A0A8H5MUX4_9HYPO|nr:MGMT family [Fusarium napiforme]